MNSLIALVTIGAVTLAGGYGVGSVQVAEVPTAFIPDDCVDKGCKPFVIETWIGSPPAGMKVTLAVTISSTGDCECQTVGTDKVCKLKELGGGCQYSAVATLNVPAGWSMRNGAGQPCNQTGTEALGVIAGTGVCDGTTVADDIVDSVQTYNHANCGVGTEGPGFRQIELFCKKCEDTACPQ